MIVKNKDNDTLLRAIMEAGYSSLKEFAIECGFSERTVEGYLNGIRGPIQRGCTVYNKCASSMMDVLELESRELWDEKELRLHQQVTQISDYHSISDDLNRFFTGETDEIIVEELLNYNNLIEEEPYYNGRTTNKPKPWGTLHMQDYCDDYGNLLADYANEYLPAPGRSLSISNDSVKVAKKAKVSMDEEYNERDELPDEDEEFAQVTTRNINPVNTMRQQPKVVSMPPASFTPSKVTSLEKARSERIYRCSRYKIEFGSSAFPITKLKFKSKDIRPTLMKCNATFNKTPLDGVTVEFRKVFHSNFDYVLK